MGQGPPKGVELWKERGLCDKADPSYSASSNTHCVTAKVTSLSLSFPHLQKWTSQAAGLFDQEREWM